MRFGGPGHEGRSFVSTAWRAGSIRMGTLLYPSLEREIRGPDESPALPGTHGVPWWCKWRGYHLDATIGRSIAPVTPSQETP